jgi:hypothetical protein
MPSRSQPSTETPPTPTPWEWDSGIIPPDGPERYCDIYVDGGDKIIAEVNDCIPEGEANAALIVEAVNSHAALKARVAELEEALRALRLQALQSSVNDPANEWGLEALHQANAALQPKAGS